MTGFPVPAMAAGIAALWLLCAPVAAAGELRTWGGGATPALKLRDLDGRMHDLADYRGCVVLVNFWATWCEPCREEMPAMQNLGKKLAGKPFVVLAVNLDEPVSRIRRFLEKMPLDFPLLLDEGRVATRAWGVRVLPASFIVGRDGRIRYSLSGDLAWDHPSVVSLLSELMPAR